MMVSSKSVNIDTAIACNPEIIAFLPERWVAQKKWEGLILSNDIYWQQGQTSLWEFGNESCGVGDGKKPLF